MSGEANLQRSVQILRELAAVGVQDICVCAGARNSPLVTVLARSQGFQVMSFFEERSAAFFALGRARRQRRPVAIVTTSGTAAAELLPAAVEAYYSGVPLILVTADRPARLRHSGAPQTIDQTGLFAKFVAAEWDLQDGELSLPRPLPAQPLHINVCFDEPLLPSNLPEQLLCVDKVASNVNWDLAERRNLGRNLDGWRHFLAAVQRPLVIVGTLETKEEKAETLRLLRSLRWPCYLEATSGLRGHAELQELEIKRGDLWLRQAWLQGQYDGVLRLGGIPTLRLWRDFENQTRPVLSVSRLPFTGLSGSQRLLLPWQAMSQLSVPAPSITPVTVASDVELIQLLKSEPLSEAGQLHALSYLLAEEDLLYLGNSLPIREWDLAARRDQSLHARASRGVNGIDGQISTFLGLLEPGLRGWAVVGDLTALYDMAGPWALRYVGTKKVAIVVVNNSGGRIFSRMFNEPLFENQHDLDFAGLARQWHLRYERWDRVPESFDLQEPTLIELRPDAKATERFWQQVETLSIAESAP